MEKTKESMKKELSLSQITHVLFYLLIFILPLNLRHIFNFEKIQRMEGFREHLTYSFYAFDFIFLLLVFVFIVDWFLNFQNKTRKSPGKNAMVLWYTVVKKQFSRNPLIWFAVAIVMASILAFNQAVAFYQVLRIFQAIILFLIAIKFFQNKKVFNVSVLIVFFSGVFQALLGISQFICQKSLGLKLFGESVLAPNILGVAKFEIAGEKLIRAYGTFPHPNLLAAFLLFSLAAGIWVFIQKNELFKLKGKGVLVASGLAVILFGILLTYSRSVIFATIFFFLIIGWASRKKIWKFYKNACKDLKIHPIFQTAVLIIFIFTSLFILYNILAPRLCFSNCAGDESIFLRLAYVEASLNIIKENPLLGTGPGNFTEIIREHSEIRFLPWELHPVHNLYLLIVAEIGLIGLVIFLLVIFRFLFACMRVGTGCPLRLQRLGALIKNPFFVLILLYFLLGLVDHYFWTLPQGILLFWLSLAFCAGSSNIKLTKIFFSAEKIQNNPKK